MVLASFSTGMDSNRWMGVDYANDTDILKIDRCRPTRAVLFQMRMKMDVNIVRPAGDRGPYRLQEELNNTPFFILNIHPGSGGQAPSHFHSTVMAKKINTEENRRQTTIIFLHRRPFRRKPVPGNGIENPGQAVGD